MKAVLCIALCFVLTLFVLAALLLFLVAPSARAAGKRFRGVKFAHRGLWGKDAPENSMEAFRRAVEAGFGIELDVWLCADGTLAVFHDISTGRVCGDDLIVPESTRDELLQLSLGGTEEKIPLFSEVLNLVDGRVPILIELKSRFSETVVVDPVMKALEKYDGDFCIESFNPFAICRLKKKYPHVTRGQLSTRFGKIEEPRRRLPLFLISHLCVNFLSRPDFIAYDYRYAKNPSVSFCKRVFKTPVFVWTVQGSNDTICENFDCIIFENGDKA